MTPRISSWLHRGQSALLFECLIWAFVVAAIHASVATVADWDRFEPVGFNEYWPIISDRWSFVPYYVLWIGVPLVLAALGYSRNAGRRRPRARRDDDEYRMLDLHPSAVRSPIEIFTYLYLGAMIAAGFAHTAVAWCLMRGECGFFTWYQGVLYWAVFWIWPLLLLLLRHALWKIARWR
jgi:hypothetical protein